MSLAFERKKGTIITNAFQNISDDFNHKPIKIGMDKGSEFYNNSMKSWFQNNGFGNYPTQNEGKPVVAERYIRNLMNKSYKYMISVFKNVYTNMNDQNKVYWC